MTTGTSATSDGPSDAFRPWSPEWYARQTATLGESACRALGFYAIPGDLRLSVVIPVYNEEKTLRVLVDRVRAVPIRKEILLIDDCSKDRTRDVLKALEAEGGADDFN
ncbi:MAG: glycosyltransferase, partial [Planctomycetaceae bacterium]